jgi:uncharacterized protein YcbK (DUF882 family)
MRPRSPVTCAVAVIAVVAAALPLPASANCDARTLWLYNVHTREELRIRPFASATRLRPLAWRRINRVLRSWRTDRRRPMHPRLVRTLARVQNQFAGRRIEVVSGYRVPEDTDNLSSYHQVGRAADVRIPGVRNRALFDSCRALQAHAPLGCGYYPNGNFVHIDVRGKSALWVDLGRPGAGRRYVADPVGWLRRHRG